MYSARISLSKDDWLKQSGRILMSWGIFNPAGPTINCIGVRDGFDSLGRQEVFWRWVHWLQEGSFAIGVVDPTEPDWRIDLHHQLLSRFGVDELAPPGEPLLSTVPQFVAFADDSIKQALSLPLLGAGAMDPGSVVRELAQIQAWGPDLFSRSKSTSEPASLAPIVDLMATYQDWLDRVSSTEFVAGAATHFAAAWVGAINFTGEDFAAESLQNTYEDLVAFLDRFEHPIFPDASTPEIERRYGVGRAQINPTKKGS